MATSLDQPLIAPGPDTEQWDRDAAEIMGIGAATPAGGQSVMENVTGGLSNVLHAFGAPSRALWSGVQALAENNQEGVLHAAKEGFVGNRDTELADVVGLPRTSPEDTWPEFLGKGGLNLLVNAVGDPLTWAFAPAKALNPAVKGVRLLNPFRYISAAMNEAAPALGLKEGQSLAGKLGQMAHLPQAVSKVGEATGLNKALRTSAPDELTALTQEASQRIFGERQQEILKALQLSKQAEQGLSMPIDEARELWQTAGKTLSEPAARKYLLEKGLTEPLIDAYQAQHDMMESLTSEFNKVAMEKSFDPIGRVSEQEVRHVPRVATQEASDRIAQLGRKAELQPEDFFSLELQKLIDPATGTPVKWANSERPVIQKASFLDKAPTGEYLWQGKPVQLVQPTLKDIEEGIPALKGMFVPGAAESYAADASKKLRAINWMQSLFQPLEDAGKVSLAVKGQPLEEGTRRLKIPGLTQYAAEGKLADYLENSAVQNFHWNTPVDAYTRALKAFNSTGAGQTVRDFNQWWKNNILPLSLRFHGGNIGSNQIMEWAYGNINPAMIPIRDTQYAMVQAGKGGDIVKGLTNEVLRDELRMRGLGEYGGAGVGEAGDAVAKAIKGPGNTQKLIDMIPVEKGGTADKALQWIPDTAEKWGQLNQLGFKVGRTAEENARGAVALNWMLEHHPDVTGYAPEELAKVLDQAAHIGKTAMIDYSQSTPFIREASNIVPFAKWIYGSGKLFGKLATEDPAKIARLDRALNTALTPLTPEEKKIADKWQIENLPFTGVMGHPLAKTPEGMKNMIMAGRFLPTNTLETLINRPLQGAYSMMTPAIGGPLGLVRNYSTFKERDIDQEAKGFLGNLTSPLVGKPYEKARSYTLGWNPPAAVDYAIGQSPLSYYQQVLQSVQPLLGFQDPYKAEQTPSEMGAYIGTGGKYYPFDTTKQLKRRQYEASDLERTMSRNMKDALRRSGEATDPGAQQRAMKDYEFYSEQWQNARFNRPLFVEAGN